MVAAGDALLPPSITRRLIVVGIMWRCKIELRRTAGADGPRASRRADPPTGHDSATPFRNVSFTVEPLGTAVPPGGSWALTNTPPMNGTGWMSAGARSAMYDSLPNSPWKTISLAVNAAEKFGGKTGGMG